jgi:hypothetical protein
VFLSHYQKEKVLYERRLQLLEILDDLENDFYGADYSMNDDAIKLVILRKEFADVLNPVNVEEELKKIYPEHLYSPRKN